MKNTRPGTLVAIKLLFLLSIINESCRKKDLPPPPPQSPPPAIVNTAPKVSAGANIGLLLPLDSVFLHGSANDAENNIDSYRWSQLSGPGQAILQTPGLPYTNISRLIKGEYSFELSVLDKGGLTGKANVKVMVYDSSSIGTNVKIFKVQDVTCWGPECTLLGNTSNTPIYPNVPIKVYLKSVVSSVWVEIPQQNYSFSSNGQYFWIEWYGLDDTLEWEVMVVS